MATTNIARYYYAILEVSRTATHETIKASYRRLALLHHPDKNGGARSATFRTQLLNEAWDVLGDMDKKRVYDNNIPPQTGTANPAPPQPQPQPPRSDASAEDELRAKSESQKKRQEWLNWERLQEQSIRQSRLRVKTLETEITNLAAKIDEHTTKLANDKSYWLNMLVSLSTRLAEDDRKKLCRETIEYRHVVSIKSARLRSEQAGLEELERDLERRKELENARRERERYEQERKEKAREQEAQVRAAEAATKQREDFAAKRRAEYQAQYRARQRATAERAEAAEKEHAQRVREYEEEVQERLEAAKNTYEANHAREKAHCTHQRWWDPVSGRYDCEHCTKPCYFAMQCRDCQTIGCTECMWTLIAGRVPVVDNSWRAGSSSSRRGDTYGNEEEPYIPPPMPPQAPSFAEYGYDHWGTRT